VTASSSCGTGAAVYHNGEGGACGHGPVGGSPGPGRGVRGVWRAMMALYNPPMLLTTIITLPLLCPSPSEESAKVDPPPNVVIIFTDDQGYGDVGVYGAERFATPNLDRMAAEGMRFTDFYVTQPVCSASRAGLLTGCYPNRIGITGALGPGARHGISDEEVTLGELCKSKGYATAVFGKWHLGHHEQFLPPRHGFDEYLGIPYSNDMWPLHPDLVHLPEGAAARKRGYPDLPLIEGDRIVNPRITSEDQRRFTTQFTERAVAFIERNRDQPFFLYVAHPMPHVPLHVSDKFRGKTERGLYGDVISEIDWSVGQILGALRENGIDERTLVIFTSDNGPWLSYGDHAGSAGPLREGKGTTFEGGVRVPCIMRWPGRIPAGAVCAEPAMTIDVFPTVAELIGAGLPGHVIDGRSILALMAGQDGARSPHEALFFYYHRNDLEAMRSGRWKLHFPHGYRSMEGREPGHGGTPGKYDYDRRTGLELYDLSVDVGESENVADEHPEVVRRLLELADTMRADLGDALTGAEPTGARGPGRLEAGDGEGSS
jgi:arylsulfatase A